MLFRISWFSLFFLQIFSVFILTHYTYFRRYLDNVGLPLQTMKYDGAVLICTDVKYMYTIQIDCGVHFMPHL